MFTFRSEDEYATRPGAVEITLGVNLHAVGHPGSLHIGGIEKDTPVGDGAIRLDIPGHPAWRVPHVGNVKGVLIWREGNAIEAGELGTQ